MNFFLKSTPYQCYPLSSSPSSVTKAEEKGLQKKVLTKQGRALVFVRPCFYKFRKRKKRKPFIIRTKQSSSFRLKNLSSFLPDDLKDRLFQASSTSFITIKAKIKEKMGLTFFSAFCLHNFQKRFQLKSANQVLLASVFFGPTFKKKGRAVFYGIKPIKKSLLHTSEPKRFLGAKVSVPKTKSCYPRSSPKKGRETRVILKRSLINKKRSEKNIPFSLLTHLLLKKKEGRNFNLK